MYEAIRNTLKGRPLLYDAARLVYRTCDQLRIAYVLCQRPAIIANYCQAHRIRKLNLGAGPVGLKGWLNCDLQHEKTPNAYIYLDIRERFPFGDQLFDYVFSEHLIEHVSLVHGEFFLAECFRCLKPGGRIRIATPDLSRLVAGYLAQDPASQRYVDRVFADFFPGATTKTPAAALNNIMNNFGHRFLFDEQTLRLMLTNAGFHGVVRQAVGVSEDPELRGIEVHGDSVGPELNEYETMVLEAWRSSVQDRKAIATEHASSCKRA